MHQSNRPSRDRTERTGRFARLAAPDETETRTIAMSAASSRRLIELVRRAFEGRRLVIVSNREPVIHERRRDGSVEVVQPASGLTTAMLPIVRACGGVWVAHGSGSADFDVADARDGIAWPPGAPSFRVRRVRLPREVERGYYYGFANEGLWPLCHLAYTAPVFRHGDWDMYREANRLFANAVLDEIGDEPAVVLLHDYHFGLLPRMLRVRRPDLLIAHFWHIPWPHRDVMRVLPWREEFLDGMLGSDLLGFQVKNHCENFLDTVDRGIEALVDPEHERVVRGGHSTYVRPFPISIDVGEYAQLASRQDFEKCHASFAERVNGQLLLLGVDRLDYTKGIPHRLRILESLLARFPEYRGRLRYVQVGAPTRTSIPRYEALANEILDLVSAVNARFRQPNGWQPVEFLHAHHDRNALASLYRRADGCLVTSLHDGMNLVAKEFVAAHAGTPGTLLLSKYTGASRELLEGCLVNPYDVEGSAALLVDALRMPVARRAAAMKRMYDRIASHDVYDWAAEIFGSLDEVSRRHEATSFPGN